jgi:hypothetical protein
VTLSTFFIYIFSEDNLRELFEQSILNILYINIVPVYQSNWLNTALLQVITDLYKLRQLLTGGAGL